MNKQKKESSFLTRPIFFTIVFFSFNQVQANPCGRGNFDVRLDEPGYSASHLKSRMQYYDICYAHAASDMADAYRFHVLGDKDYKHLTSPLAAAIRSNNDNKAASKTDGDPKSFEIGQICSTVRTIFRSGSCSFKEVDRKIYQNVLKNKPVGYREDSDGLSSFFTGLHQLFFKSQKSSQVKKETTNELMCYFRQNASNLAETESQKTAFIPTLSTITKAIDQDYYLDFLQTLLDGYCPKPLAFDSVPFCNEFYPQFMKQKYISQKIHSQLSKGKKALPIGIDFCERVLITGKAGTQKELSNGDKCIRHATTIIGRRQNQGRCEILLKNTSFCNELSSKYDCDPKTGKVWVNEDDLINSTFGIHYFGK
jgi:hypothetical protein